MGHISKFLPWKENFTPEHDASGLKSIPPGNLTHFGRPKDENFDSVFLTDGRPEPDCTLRCDEMGQISTFLPRRENFALEHDTNDL